MRRSIQIKDLRTTFSAFTKAGFLRSVGTLVGGTALAQAIAVLAMPLITRLYSPADFSLLAVYVSVLGMIGGSACFGLEMAVPMPERDEDAANLLAAALTSSAVVAVVVASVVGLFPDETVRLIRQPEFRPYLWLLPLGVWFVSSYAALQFWSTRKKRFSTIAKTRMTQAIGAAGTQVGLGWIGFGPPGLLLGQLVNSGSGLFGLGRRAMREDIAALREVNPHEMRRVVKQYERFPKYTTFEVFANNVGIQLPIVIIAALAVGPEAGYLMLAARMMAVPMGLIGSAVAQVYLSRASDEMRAGSLGGFTVKVLSGLAKSGVGPLLFAGIVAPSAFALVFGEQWRRAGELVAWMTPWFVFQFLASPISMAMHVHGRQREVLALTVFGLVTRLGAIALAWMYSPRFLTEAYAISGGIFYFVCLWIFGSVAGVSPRSIVKIFASALTPIAIWFAAALVSVPILSRITL